MEALCRSVSEVDVDTSVILPEGPQPASLALAFALLFELVFTASPLPRAGALRFFDNFRFDALELSCGLIFLNLFFTVIITIQDVPGLWFARVWMTQFEAPRSALGR